MIIIENKFLICLYSPFEVSFMNIFVTLVYPPISQDAHFFFTFVRDGFEIS